LALKADLGLRSVPGDDARRLIQGVEPFPNRALDRAIVASPEIRPADPSPEQSVSREQELLPRKEKAHRSRRVPRRMQGDSLDPTQPNPLLDLQPVIRRRNRRIRPAEHSALALRQTPALTIGTVQSQATP